MSCVYTRDTIQSMLRFLLDVIFPIHCFGCGTNGTYMCRTCRHALPHATKTPDKNIFAVLQYRDPLVRTLIWHLKYRGKHPIAEPLAHAVNDTLLEELGEHILFDGNGMLLLVPIPLSKKRERERGYNQSTHIARELASMNSSFLSLDTKTLARTHNTQSQTDIKDKKKRKQNVRDCFTVTAPDRVQNVDIVLIDDVTTTGATLLEARKALLKTGARSVLCIAVAH